MHEDISLRWSLQTGYDSKQGRLSGSIRSKQAGDAGPEPDGQLAYRHLEPEPLGHLADDDGVAQASLRNRARTTRVAAVAAAAMSTAETQTSNPAVSAGYLTVSLKR